MFFEFVITTEAKRTQANPKNTIIQLKPGTVHQIDAIFPGGCAALMHFQVYNQLFQIFPSNPDASFASDNEKISWGDAFELDQPPYQLKVVTWNDDDLYPHSLRLRFAMVAEPIPEPPTIILSHKIDLTQLEQALQEI